MANNNKQEELAQLREALAHLAQERDELRGELGIARTERETLTGELRIARTERDLLKERLAALIGKFFAASSEARGSEQRDLFFNEAEALAPVAQAEANVQVPAHVRAKRGRKPLDPALPREVIRHELPEA
ncbi:MAG: hypothetical protein ACREJ1_06215, partial [Candidatus Methylomirabilales bacterium]